jgi:hypothetical protein
MVLAGKLTMMMMMMTIMDMDPVFSVHINNDKTL